MDKINVNAIAGKDYILSEVEQGSKTSLQQGDIVEGVITDVSDMISITFNDKEVRVPQSAVQNAKEGQIRKFEIKDISNKSIVLREVGTNTEEKSSGVLQTNVLTGGKAFSGYIQEKSSEELLSKKEQVQSQMEKARTSLTVEDYISLKELDQSPEESSSEEFEKNLERIKQQRQFTEEHLQKQIERLDAKRDNIERVAIAASGDSSEIAKRLEEANLPVTKANIDRVSTALEMASRAPSLTEDAKAYLIDNEQDITPENIYKAAFSASKGTASNHLSEEQWQELKPKLVSLLENEGIQVDEDSLSNAKWLLSNDLAVTDENLEKLATLNTLQQSKNERQVLELCIQGMKEKSHPEKTNLVQAEKSLVNIKKTVSTMKLLQSLSLEAAEQIKPEEMISLQNISQYQTSSEVEKQSFTDIKNITAKRQLEEVRQKLTMENCYRLYQQGIEVDTEGLEEVVNKLKALEDSYNRQLYQMAGVEPEETELDLLSKTNQVVDQLKATPDMVLATTFTMRRTITLMGLYENSTLLEEESLGVGTTAKITSYETLMTAPRKDLGDSIKKAFRNVDTLLQDLGMETTDSNRQAVRILGYNSMEINEEQILEMKKYQLQVQSVITSLTPEVAVSLIKEGENPLQIPLSELNEKLVEMKQSLGTTSEEKFSEYLYKLDQKKGLTKEQRDAYIGVYRLLYQVEKTDGAAIGAVVKANQELTLGNLLTAVRSKKKEGMDVVADESFGGIDTVATGSSITEQISKVFVGRQMAHEVYENISPNLIDQSYKEESMESFMDLEITEMYEASKQGVEEMDFAYQTEKYGQLLANLSKTKEAEVLVANGQVVNANQLEAATLLMAEGSTLYQDIKEQAKKLSPSLEESILTSYDAFTKNLEKGDLTESFEDLTKELNQMFETVMMDSDVSTDQIDRIRRYQNCIRLATNLNHHQTFELPVVIGEEVVNLKVKLVEGQQDASSVKIQMSSEEFGTLDTVAVVKENTLQAYIVCNNRQVVEGMTKNQASLQQEIEALGLKVNDLTITMNRKTKEFYQRDMTDKEITDKPSNQTLYQLAKIFVKYAKQTTI